MKVPSIEVVLPSDVSEKERTAADWLFGVLGGLEGRFSLYYRGVCTGIIELQQDRSILLGYYPPVKRVDILQEINGFLQEAVDDCFRRFQVPIGYVMVPNVDFEELDDE